MRVVLRHKDLPGHPYVFDTPDGVVPSWLKESGWSIDSKTDPGDADAEAAETQAKAAEKAARKAAPKPRFADDGDFTDPTETAKSGQASAAPDSTKE